MDYMYLKLLPTPSLKNETTDKIALRVNLLYKSFNDRKKNKDKGKFLAEQQKLGIYTRITKDNISFYAIVPKFFYTEFRTACENAWKGINIEEVDEIPNSFDNGYTETNLSTKKSNALSLRVNKTDNFLLSSVLSVVDILQEDEEVGIYYNFIPTSSVSRKDCRSTFKEDIDRYRKNFSVDKEKTAFGYLKNTVTFCVDFVSDLVADLGKEFNLDMNVTTSNDRISDLENDISQSTKDKGRKQLISTQIILLAKSTDRKREKTINEYIGDNFDCIKEDNEFIYKHKNIKKNKVQKPFDFLCSKYSAPISVLSELECQHLISLPGKTIMDNYKMIDNIPYKQSIVPECAKKGYLMLGENNNKTKLDKVFFSNENKEIATTGTYIIGPMGSGKTTFIKHFVCDAIRGGDLVVLFDYIGNNALTRALSDIPDKYKQIINVGEYRGDNAQSIFYNELDVNKLNPKDYKTEEDYKEAYLNMLSIHISQIINLIKGINGEGTGASVSRRMSKIIRGACVLVLSNKNTVFMDIYKAVVDHKVRYSLLENVPDFVKEEYGDEIKEMLDAIDKKVTVRDEDGKVVKDENGDFLMEVVGTEENSITFLLDRFAVFKENRQLKKLSSIPHENNIDFSNLFLNLKKKVVIIQVPGDSFMGESKDIICNFYASKILLAMEQRQIKYVTKNPKDPDGLKMTLAHVIFDEAHLLKSTMILVEDYLTQFRKFRVKPMFTGHYLGQLDKKVADSILAAGYNFIITGKIDERHFKDLNGYFDDFTYEDCKNLLERHLMVSLRYREGTRNFILKAPDDVTGKVKEYIEA